MSPRFLSLLSLGFCMGPRIWAHVGGHDKPSLLAWPSPVVPLGKHVTLQCHSHPPFEVFKVFKRNGTSFPELQRHHVNTFTLGPVTTAHTGSYTCSGSYGHTSVWSAHSDPLQIVVTGVFTKPSISAHPGPLVPMGGNVTLRCHSLLLFDKFILHKNSSTRHSQDDGEKLPGGRTQAHFLMGPMTSGHAGTYRCYGSLHHSPYEWSAPSDSVDIMITGIYKKPSLSAELGPVVRSGENVTLLCSSKSAFDLYHLSREGAAQEHWLAGGQSHSRALQADFPLGPATPAHGGVYRCYGSFNHSPYRWSDPSDPLYLPVTGSTTSTCPSPTDPSTTEEQLPQGPSSQLYVLLGVSTAFVPVGIFLAALVCRRCPTRNHRQEARAAAADPGRDAAIVEPEPKEDRMMNGEDPAAEDTQDVIYAHVNGCTRSEGIFTSIRLSPTSSSAESTIYMEFSVNQGHAET